MKKIFYERNFGCEFEFSTSFDKMKKIVSKAVTEIYGRHKLRAREGWYKSTNNFNQWHLKTDSSTLSELCTPVSNCSNIKQIQNVLSKIGRNKDVKITNNDSFHVHMDIKDINRENVLILWLKYERIIFSLFPSHRRNGNTYCARIMDSHLKKGKQVSEFFKSALEVTWDHHSAISFFFFKKNKKRRKRGRNTVEFRLGEGTTDKVFIHNWLSFLLHFLERCKLLESPVETVCDQVVEVSEEGLDGMIKELDIHDEGLKKWLHDRFAANYRKQKKIETDLN
jgi:hypothetical protein